MNLKSLAVVVSCMCCLSVPVQANAAEKETVAVNAVSTGEVEPLAAGLISTHLLSCTSGTKKVYITATTSANEQMSEIGFTDIKILRSSDRTNWTTEKTVSDFSDIEGESHNVPNLRLHTNAITPGGKSGGVMYYTSTYNTTTYKSAVAVAPGGSAAYNSWGVNFNPTLLRFYKQNPYI
jgi:hypothetical protein